MGKIIGTLKRLSSANRWCSTVYLFYTYSKGFTHTVCIKSTNNQWIASRYTQAISFNSFTTMHTVYFSIRLHGREFVHIMYPFKTDVAGGGASSGPTLSMESSSAPWSLSHLISSGSPWLTVDRLFWLTDDVGISVTHISTTITNHSRHIKSYIVCFLMFVLYK